MRYVPSHADHSSSDFIISTLLHLPWVEEMPYGRFWMGKWLSGDTEMKDVTDILLDHPEMLLSI